MTDRTAHVLAINDLLTRFFQAFDDKDWRMTRICLCDELFIDYSSFRGVPASAVTGDQYVALRQIALQALEMQHNFLNLRVELDAAAESATARCNYIIHRFPSLADGGSDRYLHSYGHYLFAFARIGDAWRIARITQKLLRNQGDREIHPAVGD